MNLLITFCSAFVGNFTAKYTSIKVNEYYQKCPPKNKLEKAVSEFNKIVIPTAVGMTASYGTAKVCHTINDRIDIKTFDKIDDDITDYPEELEDTRGEVTLPNGDVLQYDYSDIDSEGNTWYYEYLGNGRYLAYDSNGNLDSEVSIDLTEESF